MIIQICGAFVAVVTMGVIASLPKKFLLIAGGIAAISWMVYLIFDSHGVGVGLSTFMATCVSAFISNLLARSLKAPVTMFLIPGILPLVPGVNTYRIAYYVIAKDGANATYYMNATLTIAGMIAIGVFIIDTVFKVYATLKKKR